VRDRAMDVPRRLGQRRLEQRAHQVDRALHQHRRVLRRAGDDAAQRRQHPRLRAHAGRSVPFARVRGRKTHGHNLAHLLLRLPPVPRPARRRCKCVLRHAGCANACVLHASPQSAPSLVRPSVHPSVGLSVRPSIHLSVWFQPHVVPLKAPPFSEHPGDGIGSG
jgi:hypothetical protein